jgi:hypothetical protein
MLACILAIYTALGDSVAITLITEDQDCEGGETDNKLQHDNLVFRYGLRGDDCEVCFILPTFV